MQQHHYLCIVGRGAFAQHFADRTESLSLAHPVGKVVPLSWQNELNLPKSAETPPLSDIAPEQLTMLHVGGGRQLDDVIAFCQQHGVLLIQASTGQTVNLPSPQNFPSIEAPNLSLIILKLLYLLEGRPKLFDGLDISITESHQASKTSTPGTALKLAALLGASPDAITSVRDPKTQRRDFQIPDQFLDGHALHDIRIKAKGAEISLGTKVLGRDTYIDGALSILAIKQQLNNKAYFIVDLIDQSLL